MQSKARTVEQYLAELSDDRRALLQVVREIILENLPEGYEEGMQYGMIGYFVPHSIYPAGYHCDPKQPLPFVSLAAQKQYCSLYMMCLYSTAEDQEWFQRAWKATGKNLDMGKSCLRFRKLDDLALDVIGEAIRRVPVDILIKNYEAALAAPRPKTGKTVRKASTGKKAVSSRSQAVKKMTKKRTPRS